MDEREAELRIPPECAEWCRAQDEAIVVDDDIAPVDLDWWNTHLADRAISVRLWARDPDGLPVDTGKAFLRRGDLNVGLLPDEGPPELCVLYRAASWLMGHPRRARAKRFLDVRTVLGRRMELDTIVRGLRLCKDQHFICGSDVSIDSSPWPATPGVGPAVLSLYCWAVMPNLVRRPQLLDQDSLSTLCHVGWLQTPSLPAFTRVRYIRYCNLLHRWAGEVGVSAELVEMWLADNWQERTRAVRNRISNDRG